MAEQAKVPAIRFAGFTDPWEQRKLGELTESYSGGTPAAGESEFYGGSIPFIRSAEIAAESTELFLTEKGYESSSARMVKPGDVLYALYGATSGEVAVSRQKGAINQAILAILPRDDCDARYITAWLRKQKGYIVTTYLQGGQGNLSGVIVKNLEVSIPSLPEQQKIGFMLSHLDSLITLHQRKYDKLVIFKKSMLEKMFPKDGESVPEIRFAGFTDPWEQRKLGELALTYSGGTPSAGNSAYYGGEIPFIRSAEIDCDSTELSLTVAGLNNSSAKLVDKGMVLYAMYGATSGEVAISKIKGAINQAILAMDASDMAANRFIAYWLRRQKKSITETFLQGGQGNLSGAIIKELGIPQPSLDEQRQIGSFFSNLDDLITLHQRKLELLQNIKKSLLDKMFA